QRSADSSSSGKSSGRAAFSATSFGAFSSSRRYTETCLTPVERRPSRLAARLARVCPGIPIIRSPETLGKRSAARRSAESAAAAVDAVERLLELSRARPDLREDRIEVRPLALEAGERREGAVRAAMRAVGDVDVGAGTVVGGDHALSRSLSRRLSSTVPRAAR